MTASEGTGSVNLSAISESQARYIREYVPGATIYPPGSQPGGTVPAEFFYRAGHVLTRDRDRQDVLNALLRLAPTLPVDGTRLERAEVAGHPIPGLTLIQLIFNKPPGEDPIAQEQIMFSALEAIAQQLGPGKARPDHLLSVAQGPNIVTWCPAGEPVPVPPDAA